MPVRIGVRIRAVLLCCSLAPLSASAQSRHTRDHFATSDGVEPHDLEVESEPTLVFVPGWTRPAQIWRAQLDYRPEAFKERPMKSSMMRFVVTSVFSATLAHPLVGQADEEAAEVIRIEDQWAVAVRNGDVETLRNIIADDYLGTTATGAMQDKESYLADFISGDREVSLLTTEDLEVRLHGSTAVLTHGGRAEAVIRGSPVSGTFRWTHVLVRRDGQWEVVTNHVTRVQRQ